MAPTGLFPREAPRPTSSEAERRLWRALAKHLPEGWTVWHSMRVRAPRGADGEGDFVFAVPGRGAFVLEVKGGDVEVRDGRWFQDGRELFKAPRDQAFGYIQKLRKQLVERYPKLALPFIAVATAFPETDDQVGPTNGDVAGTTLTAMDLPYLRDALLALVDRLFNAAPAPDGPWVEALHELWGETWVRDLSLGSRTKRAELRRVALDAEQIVAMQAVDTNPRMFVAGGPGTGKTILAVEIARRWAARGRTPVLLCFTRALAMELRDAGCAAWTVRELAADVIVRSGALIEGGAPPASWSPQTWSDVPKLALESLSRAMVPFDAVVVDEAQDLAADDWAFVRAVAGSGPLWVFGDEAQGFWSDRREVPADVKPCVYVLASRYRCPAELTAFADRYRPGAGNDVLPGPVEGLRVVRVAAGSIEEACGREVEQLLGDGVTASQIAVLSLGGQTKTRIGIAERIGSVAAVRADAEAADHGLVSDTFLRFKGLERPWVIVTELDLGRGSYDVRMHIALSRATVGCIVVVTDDDLMYDGRLRAVMGGESAMGPRVGPA